MATCPPKCKRGTRCKTRKCVPFYNAKFYDIEKIINPNGIDPRDSGKPDCVSNKYETSLHDRIHKHLIKHKYKTGDLLHIGNSDSFRRLHMGVYVVIDKHVVQGEDYNGVWDVILSDTYSTKLKQHGVKYKKLLDRPLPAKSDKINNEMLPIIIPWDEDDIIRDLRLQNLY